MTDGIQSPAEEIPRGTHIVISKTGDSMSIFHDGDLDPRIDGTVITDSVKITEVDWDKDTGEWVSRLKDGTELCRRATKSEVVALEHQILAEMEARGELKR